MQRDEPVELKDVDQLLIRPANPRIRRCLVTPERRFGQFPESQHAAEEGDQEQKESVRARGFARFAGWFVCDDWFAHCDDSTSRSALAFSLRVYAGPAPNPAWPRGL